MNLDAYHRSRSVDHQPFRSACYAPFNALSFDVHGTVSVCSFTRSTPLGRVGETPLAEMWAGARARSLRSAVATDDLTSWCGRCAEEIEGGNLHGVLAVGFDQFPTQAEASWPTRMEFALSNACNLQCVMCDGEYSSAIRRRREQLPPLPDRYGSDFLSELQPFLPHLSQARFLGGEPFLAEVNFRIWELMADLGLKVECNVTTNGTQWNRRIAQILDALPFSVGISIDGTTPATVESVRAGASHARILENLNHFIDYRDRRGLSLSLTFCLMVETWREFADYLRFGEQRGCQVYVNTVRQPPRHSLYRLPSDELQPIVKQLTAERDSVAAELSINRNAWLEQLDRLENHLASTGSSDRQGREQHAPNSSSHWDDLVESLMECGTDLPTIAELLRRSSIDDRCWTLRGGPDDRLVGRPTYLGVDVSSCAGQPMAAVRGIVADHLGHEIQVISDRTGAGAVVRVVTMSGPGRADTAVASVTLAGEPPHGTIRIAAMLPSPSPTRVHLRGRDITPT